MKTASNTTKSPRKALHATVICPITKRIMNDPVILCNSGLSYERSAIEKWIREHNTDPETNAPLTDRRVMPNKILALLIRDLRAAGCV